MVDPGCIVQNSLNYRVQLVRTHVMEIETEQREACDISVSSIKTGKWGSNSYMSDMVATPFFCGPLDCSRGSQILTGVVK